MIKHFQKISSSYIRKSKKSLYKGGHLKFDSYELEISTGNPYNLQATTKTLKMSLNIAANKMCQWMLQNILESSEGNTGSITCDFTDVDGTHASEKLVYYLMSNDILSEEEAIALVDDYNKDLPEEEEVAEEPVPEVAEEPVPEVAEEPTPVAKAAETVLEKEVEADLVAEVVVVEEPKAKKAKRKLTPYQEFLNKRSTELVNARKEAIKNGKATEKLGKRDARAMAKKEWEAAQADIVPEAKESEPTEVAKPAKKVRKRGASPYQEYIKKAAQLIINVNKEKGVTLKKMEARKQATALWKADTHFPKATKGDHVPAKVTHILNSIPEPVAA